MADERRRKDLGDAKSAALPVLWGILAEREWTQARLAAELGEDSGKIAKLLYGVRRPGRDLSVKLHALGVGIELWSLPMAPESWLPPHAAPAESTHDISADESGGHKTSANDDADTKRDTG